MSANQQNPATVSQLSAHEGNQQKYYYPPQALAETSNIMAYAREKGFANVDELYDWSIQNREQFWSEMATRFCDWYEPWEQVLDESEKPFFKWFTGGKINIVHNAIDRHANGANREHKRPNPAFHGHFGGTASKAVPPWCPHGTIRVT